MLVNKFMADLISCSQPLTWKPWSKCTAQELEAHVKGKQAAFNTKDTYIFCRVFVGGRCSDNFELVRHLYKDWIVYESPMFYNRVHEERDYPSNQLLIIEKPKGKKA